MSAIATHSHDVRDNVAPYDPTTIAGTAGGAALYRADRLEDRYAGAFADLATEKSVLAAVEADVTALLEMISTSPDLLTTLRNPILSRHAQSTLLLYIVDKLKLQPLTRQFLQLIGKKRRQAALPSILSAFQNETARRRGELVATVTSAAALTDQQQAELVRALGAKHQGAKVSLKVTVDPALIGGMTIRIGSRLYDRSVASQLQRLQHKLTQAA